MQKGFGIIYILIAIIVLGLVAGGAYYIGKSSSTPQPLSPPPSSTLPKPVDKNIPSDQIANWKTYTNNEYGFTLKYPSNWFTGISGDGTILFDNKQINNTQVVSLSQVAIALEVVTDPQLIDFYTKNRAGDLKYQLINKDVNDIPVDYITILENGEGMPPVHIISAQILHKDRFYRLGLSRIELQNTFDQILSTFKFTSP